MICRVLKFVIPVFVGSCIFNVPKFLEATTAYVSHGGEESDETLILHVTELRLDPNYVIYYINWARLIVLGIIPVGAVLFFNVKVYQKKRVSMPIYTKIWR